MINNQQDSTVKQIPNLNDYWTKGNMPCENGVYIIMYGNTFNLGFFCYNMWLTSSGILCKDTIEAYININNIRKPDFLNLVNRTNHEEESKKDNL